MGRGETVGGNEDLGGRPWNVRQDQGRLLGKEDPRKKRSGEGLGRVGSALQMNGWG